MESQRAVKIESIKGTSNDYIIKDKDKIVAGRFTILDLNKENRRCSVKLKFYRENNYELLKLAVDTILKTIFKDGNINKVNFFISENTNIAPFLDMGFTLEAILTENLYVNGVYLDELGLGINRAEYANCTKINNIELRGKRITIKNFTPDDAGKLLDYYIRNEEHLKEFEPSRDKSFYTYEMQKKILMESYKQLMIGTGYDLGIYLKDKLIGKIKLSNIVYGVFKSGILGYSIDKEYEGNGYMKEAVGIIIKYCKEYLDLHRIEASVLLQNEKSKSVLLGCGFEEVGINKKYLYLNGRWRDHLTFAKII